MEYLKKFDTHTQYEEYVGGGGMIRPNVSYCEDVKDVHYNPWVKPNNIITYGASSKLVETTSDKNSGLHTNAFNCAIVSHTFENGVGTVEFESDVTSIGNYAFYRCDRLTSITIPSSITSIGNGVFSNCSGLTSIDIPSSVTSIGGGVFENCSSLTSIDIPSGVTSILSNTFNGCSGLTSVTIGNSVTSIEFQAFRNCISLTSIDIPNSVTSIGHGVFENCTSLQSVTSLATTAPIVSDDTFRNVKTRGRLYVPIGSSGYSVWMGTGNYYLGKYGWVKVEQ